MKVEGIPPGIADSMPEGGKLPGHIEFVRFDNDEPVYKYVESTSMINVNHTSSVETGATTLAELLLWLQFQPYNVLTQKINLRDNELGDQPWLGVIRFEGIGAIFTDEMTSEQYKALTAKRAAEEKERAAEAFRQQTKSLTDEEKRLLP